MKVLPVDFRTDCCQDMAVVVPDMVEVVVLLVERAYLAEVEPVVVADVVVVVAFAAVGVVAVAFAWFEPGWVLRRQFGCPVAVPFEVVVQLVDQQHCLVAVVGWDWPCEAEAFVVAGQRNACKNVLNKILEFIERIERNILTFCQRQPDS